MSVLWIAATLGHERQRTPSSFLTSFFSVCFSLYTFFFFLSFLKILHTCICAVGSCEFVCVCCKQAFLGGHMKLHPLSPHERKKITGHLFLPLCSLWFFWFIFFFLVSESIGNSNSLSLLSPFYNRLFFFALYSFYSPLICIYVYYTFLASFYPYGVASLPFSSLFIYIFPSFNAVQFYLSLVFVCYFNFFIYLLPCEISKLNGKKKKIEGWTKWIKNICKEDYEEKMRIKKKKREQTAGNNRVLIKLRCIIHGGRVCVCVWCACATIFCYRLSLNIIC